MSNVLKVNDQLSSKDLFEAFKTQLTKDFEQSNFDAEFIKDLEPDFVGIHEKTVFGRCYHRSTTQPIFSLNIFMESCYQ